MNIKKHRDAIAKAFKDDPDFRRTYVDNVSMLLYDNTSNMSMRSISDRNELASKIIKLVFES